MPALDRLPLDPMTAFRPAVLPVPMDRNRAVPGKVIDAAARAHPSMAVIDSDIYTRDDIRTLMRTAHQS